MKLKEKTLDEELVLTAEIAYLLGSMGHISKDNVHDRMEGIIDIINDDGMAVFAEFCKFVAHGFMNCNSHLGIEEYVASYSSSLLDEFINHQIIMTKEEELTLLNNRVIELVYTIVPITDRGRETLLISTLSHYYQVFEQITPDYHKNIIDLAKALIYMFDSRNELFDGCYGGDKVWKEGLKDRLEDLTKEYFLEVE
jgi:hypothetical protein